MNDSVSGSELAMSENDETFSPHDNSESSSSDSNGKETTSQTTRGRRPVRGCVTDEAGLYQRAMGEVFPGEGEYIVMEHSSKILRQNLTGERSILWMTLPTWTGWALLVKKGC